MEMAPTTVRILADKALEKQCGQECVDWAIGMLMQGYSGDYLSRLAGMVPPFNHFELADLRDRALIELKVASLPLPSAVHHYVVELLKGALSGKEDFIDILAIIHRLYIETNYDADLCDFSMLYYAYQSIQEGKEQHYWLEAHSGNIDEIVREEAAKFINQQK